MTMLTPPAEGVSRDTLAYLSLLEMEKYVPANEGDPWMRCCAAFSIGVALWCHKCGVGGRAKTCWICGGTTEPGVPMSNPIMNTRAWWW